MTIKDPKFDNIGISWLRKPLKIKPELTRNLTIRGLSWFLKIKCCTGGVSWLLQFLSLTPTKHKRIDFTSISHQKSFNLMNHRESFAPHHSSHYFNLQTHFSNGHFTCSFAHAHTIFSSSFLHHNSGWHTSVFLKHTHTIIA